MNVFTLLSNSYIIPIILTNYSIFKTVFGEDNIDIIEKHFSNINKARRCADHSFEDYSANWSWDNFLDFRLSISWFEAILSEYE